MAPLASVVDRLRFSGFLCAQFAIRILSCQKPPNLIKVLPKSLSMFVSAVFMRMRLCVCMMSSACSPPHEIALSSLLEWVCEWVCVCVCMPLAMRHTSMSWMKAPLLVVLAVVSLELRLDLGCKQYVEMYICVHVCMLIFQCHTSTCDDVSAHAHAYAYVALCPDPPSNAITPLLDKG